MGHHRREPVRSGVPRPDHPGEIEEFWLYDALGPRIWIHRDNFRFPERPLVFVLEITREEMGQRLRRADGSTVAHRQPGELREVRVHGPSAPSLPPFAGPPIVYVPGPPALELVVGTQARARSMSDALAIVW